MYMETEWIFFPVDTSTLYKITVFDDGNEKYSNFTNEWHLYGTWRGKIALQHKQKKHVRIQSISAWKTICEDM
jgi:hypothetical protein